MRATPASSGTSESGIDVQQNAEGTNHQPGTNQQDEGERDFHGNEKVACAMAFAVHAQGATAFGNAGADTSVFENRNQPEKQSGEQRDTESEVKNGQVDANVSDPRESGGREGNEKTQGGAGQCQAEDAAQQANNSALAE